MGGVQISPNLKRQKTFIDADGNEVEPFTRNVIKKNEDNIPYVPTREEMEAAAARTGGDKKLTDEELAAIKAAESVPQSPRASLGIQPAPAGTGNPLADMIKAQVQKALQETMKEIDIGKMVEDAVKDAFK